MGGPLGDGRLCPDGEHVARLQVWDVKVQNREKDRFKVGRKKRFLHELRLAWEMVLLVSKVLLTENTRKWERWRWTRRCDFPELLVPTPKATGRAGYWSLVAREPLCEQTGWRLRTSADQLVFRLFIERNQPEVFFIKAGHELDDQQSGIREAVLV